MSRFVTKEGRRISVFSRISQQELASIPNARTWTGRSDLIEDEAYRDLRILVAQAFAGESPDYILGFVSGFNGAADHVSTMLNKDMSYEQVWNHLMLLLSEAAHYLPADDAADDSTYLELPEPGSQDN